MNFKTNKEKEGAPDLEAANETMIGSLLPSLILSMVQITAGCKIGMLYSV